MDILAQGWLSAMGLPDTCPRDGDLMTEDLLQPCAAANAGMVEMADASDLKSDGLRLLRVQVPLSALICACGESGSRAGGGQNLRIATPPVSERTCRFETCRAQLFMGVYLVSTGSIGDS